MGDGTKLRAPLDEQTTAATDTVIRDRRPISETGPYEYYEEPTDELSRELLRNALRLLRRKKKKT